MIIILTILYLIIIIITTTITTTPTTTTTGTDSYCLWNNIELNCAFREPTSTTITNLLSLHMYSVCVICIVSSIIHCICSWSGSYLAQWYASGVRISEAKKRSLEHVTGKCYC